MFENTYAVPEETGVPKAGIDFTANAPVPEGTIDFSPQSESSPDVPLNVSDNRATKAHFAMHDQSPGLDMLKAEFASGGENDVRRRLATNRQIADNESALASLQQVSKTEGPLTPEDTNYVLNTVRTKPVDPSTVLEKEFARKFASFGTTIRPETNSVFAKGWKYAPGETAFEQNLATDIIARKEIANTIYEQAEQRWKNTPWLNNSIIIGDKDMSATDAIIRSLIPFNSWVQMRNALKGVTTNSILPGNNMAEQIEGLWLINDHERFKNTLESAVNEVWKTDPVAARVLAKAATSFSNSDQLLGNVLGWADIASVVPFGMLFKAVKGVGGLLKGGAATEPLLAPRRLANFNPYAWEEGRVGPASELLPQEVRDAAREIAGRPAEGPVMNAKRGQTFDVNRGPGMQTERGAAVEVPPNSLELQSAVEGVRDVNLPLRGPIEASRLPAVEGEPTRQQFLSAWQRYYRNRPWAAPSDVNPDGSFPPALIPRAPHQPLPVGEDRYPQMIQQIRQAMGDVVKASGDGVVNVETALVKLGDIEGAAKAGVNRIVASTSQAGIVQSTKEGANLYEFSKDLPSSLNPSSVMSANPLGLSRARAQAIVTNLQARGAAFIDKLGSSPGVERLPPEALEQAYKEAATDLRYQYHSHSDHILDIVNNVRDPYTNTRSVTMQLGNRGKLPFESSDQAELFATHVFKLPEDSYTIGQQGISFVINVTKPLNETQSTVRDLIASTLYSKTPINQISSLLFGSWSPRSAEDLLSAFNRAGRHVATHPMQELRSFFLETAKDISSLSKKERQQVQDILRANRDYVNEANERGRFFTNIGDFEVHFQDKFKVLPSEGQVKAYMSYIQLSDMDWTLRNLGALRDKQRLGIELHKFRVSGGDSPWLEGKLLREFPTAVSEDSGIYVIKDGNKTGEYFRRHDPEFDNKTINKMLNDQGYSLFQVAEPTVRPLMEATGEKDIINYVLTSTRQTKPLPWKQVEYKPGGHVIYPYDWYIKQPQVAVGRNGQNFYYGDKTIFSFSSEKEAKMWTARIEEGRKLLGNEAALDDYVSKNLPYSTAEFKSLFKTHLDAELPISYTQSGKNTIQTDMRIKDMFPSIRNDHDSTHNLYQGMDKTFLADKDMQLGTISPTGDVLKPWRVDDAPLIDPYPALNQALGQAMRSRWTNDYKIAAAEEWVQQFSHIIEGGGSSLDVIRKNPLATLYNAKLVKIADGTSTREEAVAAENARQRIIEFIGSKSEFDRNLTRIQSIMADMTFSLGGKATADWTAAHLLPAIKDPTQWTRAIAFHSHLGLFNPVQLWVQSQTMFNAMAISGPVNGSKGALMGTMQHFLSMTENPAIVDRMASITEAVTGVKAEWFKESYETLRGSGLWHVAGETAWRDSVFDPKIFQSAKDTFLDKGTMFFATGERQVRLTSWNMAYMEWRSANPTADLTNKVIGDLLNRTDTLSGNMTRASSANWQKGITSVPSQFLAYNARTTELMLGGRLTWQEKSRLFGMWSLMYGVPVAIGGSLGGFDAYSDIKAAALSRGVEFNTNTQKGIMEGIPSMLVSMITGKDYDLAKRYGPNGTSLFEDAWSGKKTIDEVIGGPSYQTMKQIHQSLRPFYSWAYGAMKGDPNEYPLQIEDFANVANDTGTGSNLIKAIYGIKTGMYATKNDVKVGPIDNVDSILRPVLGITPQSIQDTLLKRDIITSLQKEQEKEIQRALTEYRMGMDRANSNDDYNGMRLHFKKASTILEAAGLNDQQRNDVWRRFTAGNSKTLQEKVNVDWLAKAPTWFQKTRQDQLIKKQQGN